jgi:hypothetical protein
MVASLSVLVFDHVVTFSDEATKFSRLDRRCLMFSSFVYRSITSGEKNGRSVCLDFF